MKSKRKGQVLVSLLVFMTVGVIITSAAVVYIIVNTQGSSKFSLGEEAIKIAESGAENAVLRLMRDPSYSGETLTVGSGTATVTVSGSSTKTIISSGTSGSFSRKVQVDGVYVNNIFTVSSWTLID